MIPIENSLHGRVADIHFLLPESGLSIVGEYFMPIRHALMGIGAAQGEDERDSCPHREGGRQPTPAGNEQGEGEAEHED